MKEFKPTYLYVKQHNITGLKYFGKTVKSDPEKYKGSGKVWLRHINKHSNDVSTLWFKLFTDKENIVEYATKFSIDNDIVRSPDWANLKIEDGLWGGGVKGIKIKRTAEHNKKISEGVKKRNLEKGIVGKIREKKGRSDGGWKWSDEDRAKLSAQRMGRTPWNKGKKNPPVNNK
jgi:hypothetical protein